MHETAYEGGLTALPLIAPFVGPRHLALSDATGLKLRRSDMFIATPHLYHRL